MWYLQLMHADSNRVTVQLSPVCGNNLLPLRRCVCFSLGSLFPWSVHFTWVYINVKIYIYMLRERHSLFWNVCSVEGEQILSRMLCRLHSASSFMNKKEKNLTCRIERHAERQRMTRVKTNHTQGCQCEHTHQWRPDARQRSAAGPAHQAAAFCERALTACRLMRRVFVAL